MELTDAYMEALAAGTIGTDDGYAEVWVTGTDPLDSRLVREVIAALAQEVKALRARVRTEDHG